MQFSNHALHQKSGHGTGIGGSNGAPGTRPGVRILSLPPANEVWGKVIFLHMFVILFTGGGMRGCSGGACMVAPGGACVVAPRGGMHGCSGGCVWLLLGEHVWLLPGGHAWLLPGGVHGCSQGGVRGCSRGACMVAPMGACVVAPGGHAWLLQGGACMVALGGHSWDTMRYGDTINEQAVRILLECILVSCSFWQTSCKIIR